MARFPKGEVKRVWINSQALAHNLQGDPVKREVGVYLPPKYQKSVSYPLLVALAPYNSSGLSYLDWKPFKGGFIERLDRLIGTGKMGPVVVAFPDCFTSLGGNQYINSSAVGRYEDFLIQEVVPKIEEKFNAGGPGKRGCFGKSSGGYGALMHGMRHPKFWSAIACHSGGMGFEWLFLSYAPQILAELTKYNHSIEQFMTAMHHKEKKTEREFLCLMELSFAAAYDPDPTQYRGIRLPVDLISGELILNRWQNWQRKDPSLLVKTYEENLRLLKGIYIDCGIYDQYHLHFGARRLHHHLTEYQIPHFYEEFPDDHTLLDYRFDQSLPYLEKVLAETTDSRLMKRANVKAPKLARLVMIR